MKGSGTPHRLPRKHIVLLGAGHTNAHVIRMWGMRPIPDADLTCVSDYATATYSGRLPAVLSGQVPESEMEIDLVRFCASVGARLLVEQVTGIDRKRQMLLFEDRPPVPFDVLSIGIGSVPSTDGVVINSDRVLKIKPMQSFLQRLSNKLRCVARAASTSRVAEEQRPLRVAIVGSGLAGIEVLCCIPSFLRRQGIGQFTLQMISSSDSVGPELNEKTRRRVRRVFDERRLGVTLGRKVTAVIDDRLDLDDGQTLQADLVIWATGASPPPLLRLLDLPLSKRGFLLTDATLRLTSGEPIFAVGDTGSLLDRDVPKAGVHAVRQGPVVWANIRRLLNDQPLQEYRPQRSFLKLMNLGDGSAVGQWHHLAFSGRWAMRLKERIDGRFIAKYQPRRMAADEEPMPCLGCGGKLAGDALEAALWEESSGSEAVLAKEDSVVLKHSGSPPLVVSSDFFASPFDDAFLSGRIAALHAASDVIASGARPTQALANVVIPEGDDAAQRRMLRDFTAGAIREFHAMNAELVGGHTIVGPRMEVGFTVLGQPIGDAVLRKSALKTGDQLYLTKPLGVGVLLAAHMRSECAAGDYQAMLDVMLRHDLPLAEIATASGVNAATDVTGFGLAGHLMEMLLSSDRSATIELACVPLLAGSVDSIEHGIESTLAPGNRHIQSSMVASASVRASAAYRLLFDPQTCGGLLLAVSRANQQKFFDQVGEAGHPPPVWIGEVVESREGAARLRIK